MAGQATKPATDYLQELCSRSQHVIGGNGPGTPVVSFHFGLPLADILSPLRERGIYLIETATDLDKARAIKVAGIDALVAQGIESGGHRGVFDPAAPD